jgi:hypothetical protein
LKRLIGCALLLLLGACEVRDESERPAAETTVAAEDPNAIDCALNGAEKFERHCTVERAPEGDTLFLVVHHPDGGFRRFEVVKDGHGLAIADGADEARLTIEGKFLAATVANDRYLFPATIGAPGGGH